MPGAGVYFKPVQESFSKSHFGHTLSLLPVEDTERVHGVICESVVSKGLQRKMSVENQL